ncbi:hypothetical protein O181_035919 [Austropuccinia psidii MF-1]|uniref:Reverse transcriptase Ty1/copia-type domain-containing protein n=1 Tax=Austropuccinia psidii MF-1 TaxID=1389203 RepID=A0A9Q3D3K9_9BASI|nr:hypothetical protein [Austropuccinia psidii MF-1]
MVTGKLQITHYCVFHDTSIVLVDPSEIPSVVFTIPSVESYIPVPVLTAAEVEDCDDVSSPGSPPPQSCAHSGHIDDKLAFNAAESQSLEPTQSLPKGWVVEKVPMTAPNDISSSIDMSNILHSKRNRGRNVYMTDSIPKNYSKAISHEKSVDWKEDIPNKSSRIEENDIWVPVKKPSNANVLGATWVSRGKEDQNGSIVKYKSFLCVQGFSEREGVDFNKTYAPMGRMTSLQFLLSHYESLDL